MITGQIWVFRKDKMKQIFLSLVFLLFVSSANAGSCPMMAGKLQKKIEEATKIHNDGMKAHKSGDHAKSEELLKEALGMFKS